MCISHAQGLPPHEAAGQWIKWNNEVEDKNDKACCILLLESIPFFITNKPFSDKKISLMAHSQMN